MKKIVVIGGGAAGLFASGFAALNGNKVILLEKNPILGKKLHITGKGRCNVTNSSDLEFHISNCVTNGKFLYNAFYQFFVQDTIDFFEKRGVKLKIERGNRVFPESDKASDIVNVLENFINRSGVEVHQSRVTNIEKSNDKFYVSTLNDTLRSDKIIIATGGKSYPGTGSTGEGYNFTKKFGHQIITLKPALVPFEIKEDFPQMLQGLSLKNIDLKIFDNNKKVVYNDFGELLFTHYGVSGPLILSASSLIKNVKDHTLVIDLKPALTYDTLEKRIIKDIIQNSKKGIKKLMKQYLPNKMIPIILELIKIDNNKKCAAINKVERGHLTYILKNLSLTISGKRHIHESIITSGGVNVKEINPQTMESKIIKGLYFAGEIIDVDALTGGFNLQIAWSTGFVAGNSC